MNRNVLKTSLYLWTTSGQGAIAKQVDRLIISRNKMISTVTALNGKRLGSRAMMHPSIVAINIKSAQGISSAIPPYTKRWGFMKETHDQSSTPTNGCTRAIGNNMLNSQNRASERTSLSSPVHQ